MVVAQHQTARWGHELVEEVGAHRVDLDIRIHGDELAVGHQRLQDVHVPGGVGTIVGRAGLVDHGAQFVDDHIVIVTRDKPIVLYETVQRLVLHHTPGVNLRIEIFLSAEGQPAIMVGLQVAVGVLDATTQEHHLGTRIVPEEDGGVVGLAQAHGGDVHDGLDALGEVDWSNRQLAMTADDWVRGHSVGEKTFLVVVHVHGSSVVLASLAQGLRGCAGDVIVGVGRDSVGGDHDLGFRGEGGEVRRTVSGRPVAVVDVVLDLHLQNFFQPSDSKPGLSQNVLLQ